MNKTINRVLWAFLLAFCLLLASCGAGTPAGTTAAEATAATETAETTAATEVTRVGDGEKSFAFTATFLDGTALNFRIFTDAETVGEALVNTGLIIGEKGDYGLYVKSVCGVTADYNVDETYWALYVNGEMSMIGVDSVKCADVETVEFRVES